MNASKNCVDVVKHYERFCASPYPCPAGKATIGYGTTVYENGKKVRLSDPAITEPEATELLMYDLMQASKDVTILLKVPVTQAQFDALVSFAYNVGPDIDTDTLPEGLGDSTLLKYINHGIMNTGLNYDANWEKTITKEFCKWIYGGGQKLGGLVARRHTEALLFCDGIVKYFN